MTTIHPNWFPDRTPPPTPPDTFAGLVRSLRKERGLSQQAFAHLAGLNYRTVAALEHGDREGSLTTCIAIAEGLDLSPEDRLRLIQTAGFRIYPEE